MSNLQTLTELLLPKQRRSAKGLLISSGADECLLLRSPHDISNLLCLFGCHPTAAQQAVVANPLVVLKRAAQRKLPAILAEPPPASLISRGDAASAQPAKGKKRKL